MRATVSTTGLVLLVAAYLGACAAKQREFSHSTTEPSSSDDPTSAPPASKEESGSFGSSAEIQSASSKETTEALTPSSEATPGQSAGTGAGVTSEPDTDQLAAPSSAELSNSEPSDSGELDVDALRAELVLHLSMDTAEWETGGRVEDSSPARNHGTINGTVRRGTGKFGSAASFDGDGFISVPDADSLDASSALTMSAWVNFGTVGNDFSPGIVSKRVSFSDSTAYTLFLWSENKLWVDVDYENDRFASTTSLIADRWYHVAVVYDGTLDAAERVRIYVDGVLDVVGAETSEHIPAYDSDLEIGRLVGGGDAMIGMIDEVAIWRRALAPREVALLARSPLP